MAEHKVISGSDANDSLLFKQPFALRAPWELLSHICPKNPTKTNNNNKKSRALSTCPVADSSSAVSLYLLVNMPWYSEGGKIPVTDSIYRDRNLSKCQPGRGAIILLYK